MMHAVVQLIQLKELPPLVMSSYKAPRRTIPTTAILSLMLNCKCQRLKNGRARIAASTEILEIAMPRKYILRQMHFGKGAISGCQKLETGLQRQALG